MKEIKEMVDIIKRNLFINDIAYNERAIENVNIANKIRNLVASGILNNSIEERKYQVEVLDFLEFKNL